MLEFKQEVQFIFYNLVFLPFLISLAIVNTYKLTAILELKRGKYTRQLPMWPDKIRSCMF